MKKILSIDGGGIRGIIPGQILIALEQKLQKATGDPNARLVNHFDFFAGTSTGGILVAILLCPSKNDPKQPRFSAQEAVDLYVKNGGEIFSNDLFHEITTLDGVIKEKYSAAGIESCLNEYFGEVKLSELLKPSIITSYDTEERKTKFFAQHDFATKGPGTDFLLKDVCRATSAAPTYFAPKLIHSLSGVSYSCIDGGVFANNPSLCAYSEVRNAVGFPTAKDMFVVSIGTGSKEQSYSYDTIKDFGEIAWVKPIIDIMMSAASEVTDYQMVKMFSAQGNNDNYIRIQPSSLKDADPQMDDASPKNIQALIELGIETAENCSELDGIIGRILGDKDKVEFR